MLRFLAGGHETAAFAAPTSVTTLLEGFVKTDTIDLQGFAATRLSFANHVLTVDRAGRAAAHLNFAGTYTTQNFAFATDGHGGTNITHT